MKNTRLLMIAAGVVVAISILFTFTGNEAEFNYISSITEERIDKDKYFQFAGDSPLNDEDKKSFQGLNYYDIDESYIVVAELNRIKTGQTVTMPTSDNKSKTYLKYAIASFVINGVEQKLTIFQPVGDNESLLFLPFADQTSAIDTYGAGRYLDFEIPRDDELVIDFNKAYNPYCAYSDKFSCPLPPRENFLEVAIAAGEKNYSK